MVRDTRYIGVSHLANRYELLRSSSFYPYWHANSADVSSWNVFEFHGISIIDKEGVVLVEVMFEVISWLSYHVKHLYLLPLLTRFVRVNKGSHYTLSEAKTNAFRDQTAGITTRSRAKLAPDQWTVMSILAKDSDWEEVQDQGAWQTKISYTRLAQPLVTSTLLSNLMQCQRCLMRTSANRSGVTSPVFGVSKVNIVFLVVNIYCKNADDDGYEDDVLIRSDPLNEINLVSYISDFLL
ncbi:hypothetical protein C5167_012444 [Papaver somniferum]|uniref:Uncharacterized protein n=1 Tax=Papaver somniferum TaxID=3469 RepID=A0A4Y7J1E8_PAPSO|nr:hypothetical protein C5167_012444 [Papaver somniferum]